MPQKTEPKEKIEPKEKAEPKAERGRIIRIVETNLDGNKPVESAIKSIRGIGDMFAHAIATASGIGRKKIAELSDDEVKALVDVIQHPENHSIPSWLYNRRFDPVTGKDMHLAASKLQFTQRNDINEMKKMKSYKGVRHAAGLPVRGQRTKGAFRKGKTVGVSKKKQLPAQKKK